MAVEIELPRLGGVRAAAERLLEPFSEELRGQQVVINARLLTSGTVSYADEILRLLGSYGANEVLLLAAPFDFERSMSEAAQRREAVNFRVVAPDAAPAARQLQDA